MMRMISLGILLWFLEAPGGTASAAAPTAAPTAADTAAATTAYSSRDAVEPLSNSGGPSNPSPWSGYFYPFPECPFPGSYAPLPYFDGCEPQYKVNQDKFRRESVPIYSHDTVGDVLLQNAHEVFQDWCFGSLQNLHTSEDVERFLEELGALGYKKTAAMYEVAFTRASTAQDVLSLVGIMNTDKIRRTRGFYEAVLPRIKQPQVRQQLLSEMKNELGIRTTTKIYHTLLSNTRRTEDVTKLVEIMDRDGIPKTQEIYKMLISRAQRAEDATKLVEAMDRDGIPKTQEIYKMLISRAQRAEDVTRLVEAMERDGIPKQPDVYHTLLNRAQTAEDVTELLEEMERDGIAKTAQCYRTLIKKAQTADEVTELVEKMTRDGIRKTRETYNILISRAQTAEDVTKLVEEMKRDRIPKTREIYLTLISRAQMAEDLTQLVEGMERDGIPRTGDTYRTLLKKVEALLEKAGTAGTADEVTQVVEIMEREGIPKTKEIYFLLIKKAQTAEDMTKVFKEMERDRIPATRELYETLAIKAQSAESADYVTQLVEQLVEEMERHGIQFDITGLAQWFDERTGVRTSRENGAGKMEGTIANNRQLTRQTRSGIRAPGSRSPSRENSAAKAENTGSAGNITNLPESGEHPTEGTAGNAAEGDFRAGHAEMSSCEETPENVLLLARCSLRDPECGAMMGCGAWKPQTVMEFSWDSAVKFADRIWHKPGVLTDFNKLEFSQNGMSDRFVNIRKQRDPKQPRLVVETAEDIHQGKAFLVNDRILENPTSKPSLCPQLPFQYRDNEIPPIQVFWRYGKWYSVDSRRVQAIRDSGIVEYISRRWAEVPAYLRRNFVWKENVALGILVEIVDGEHNRERFDRGRGKLRDLQRKTDSHH